MGIFGDLEEKIVGGLKKAERSVEDIGHSLANAFSHPKESIEHVGHEIESHLENIAHVISHTETTHTSVTSPSENIVVSHPSPVTVHNTSVSSEPSHVYTPAMPVRTLGASHPDLDEHPVEHHESKPKKTSKAKLAGVLVVNKEVASHPDAIAHELSETINKTEQIHKMEKEHAEYAKFVANLLHKAVKNPFYREELKLVAPQIMQEPKTTMNGYVGNPFEISHVLAERHDKQQIQLINQGYSKAKAELNSEIVALQHSNAKAVKINGQVMSKDQAIDYLQEQHKALDAMRNKMIAEMHLQDKAMEQNIVDNLASGLMNQAKNNQVIVAFEPSKTESAWDKLRYNSITAELHKLNEKNNELRKNNKVVRDFEEYFPPILFAKEYIKGLKDLWHARNKANEWFANTRVGKWLVSHGEESVESGRKEFEEGHGLRKAEGFLKQGVGYLAEGFGSHMADQIVLAPLALFTGGSDELAAVGGEGAAAALEGAEGGEELADIGEEAGETALKSGAKEYLKSIGRAGKAVYDKLGPWNTLFLTGSAANLALNPDKEAAAAETLGGLMFLGAANALAGGVSTAFNKLVPNYEIVGADINPEMEYDVKSGEYNLNAEGNILAKVRKPFFRWKEVKVPFSTDLTGYLDQDTGQFELVGRKIIGETETPIRLSGETSKIAEEKNVLASVEGGEYNLGKVGDVSLGVSRNYEGEEAGLRKFMTNAKLEEFDDSGKAARVSQRDILEAQAFKKYDRLLDKNPFTVDTFGLDEHEGILNDIFGLGETKGSTVQMGNLVKGSSSIHYEFLEKPPEPENLELKTTDELISGQKKASTPWNFEEKEIETKAPKEITEEKPSKAIPEGEVALRMEVPEAQLKGTDIDYLSHLSTAIPDVIVKDILENDIGLEIPTASIDTGNIGRIAATGIDALLGHDIAEIAKNKTDVRADRITPDEILKSKSLTTEIPKFDILEMQVPKMDIVPVEKLAMVTPNKLIVESPTQEITNSEFDVKNVLDTVTLTEPILNVHTDIPFMPLIDFNREVRIGPHIPHHKATKGKKKDKFSKYFGKKIKNPIASSEEFFNNLLNNDLFSEVATPSKKRGRRRRK